MRAFFAAGNVACEIRIQAEERGGRPRTPGRSVTVTPWATASSIPARPPIRTIPYRPRPIQPLRLFLFLMVRVLLMSSGVGRSMDMVWPLGTLTTALVLGVRKAG